MKTTTIKTYDAYQDESLLLHFEQTSGEYITVSCGGFAFDVINIFDYREGATKDNYNFMNECMEYVENHPYLEIKEMLRYA